ncbi:unnamed protein product, partial [Oikopleura dioica]
MTDIQHIKKLKKSEERREEKESHFVMNAELERLLPDLATFKYSIRNPARYDLQIDLVQCVLDRLIESEKVVSLKRLKLCNLDRINNFQSYRAERALSAIVHFAREDKKDRFWPCEAVRQEDKRGWDYKLFFPINRQKDGEVCDDERMHCVSGKVSVILRISDSQRDEIFDKREEAAKRFDTTVEFSYDRRGFLLNTKPIYFERIRTWWWDDRIKRGFIRTTKGREIVNRAGCLVRFLIYSQKNSKLEEYRYQLYTEIAKRIGEAIRMSSHGIINSLTVAYSVFDSTPFFVDEGIIANVVI